MNATSPPPLSATELTADQRLLISLSGLLEYPGPTYPEAVQIAEASLKETYPDVLPLFEPFSTVIQKLSMVDIEEAYTRSFDFSKTCALAVGWHLYGEDYKRGDFLVKCRDLLRQFGIPETGELPDHLMYLLVLLSRMENSMAEAFGAQYIAPAVSKIVDGLSQKNSPYEAVLKTISQLMVKRYVVTPKGESL